jgi:hypothetical protein
MRSERLLVKGEKELADQMSMSAVDHNHLHASMHATVVTALTKRSDRHSDLFLCHFGRGTEASEVQFDRSHRPMAVNGFRKNG